MYARHSDNDKTGRVSLRSAKLPLSRRMFCDAAIAGSLWRESIRQLLDAHVDAHLLMYPRVGCRANRIMREMIDVM